MDDIKDLSKEELDALSKKLAIKALKRWVLIFAIKWLAIYTIGYIGRKLYERA